MDKEYSSCYSQAYLSQSHSRSQIDPYTSHSTLVHNSYKPRRIVPQKSKSKLFGVLGLTSIENESENVYGNGKKEDD